MRTLQICSGVLLLCATTLGCGTSSSSDGTAGAPSIPSAFAGTGGGGANSQGGGLLSPAGMGPGGASSGAGGGLVGGADQGGADAAGGATGTSGSSGSASGGAVAQGGTAAAGTSGNATGGAGAATGGGSAMGGSTGALHVNGKVMNDGAGQKVALRGPELVIRWGVYSGITAAGVDVPWEGGSNNNVGAATIREIAKTKANAIRIYGGIGNELEDILKTAVVEQKMFVGVGRVDWGNAQMMTTLKKYEKFIFLHPRGEFTHRDSALWRTEALTVVKYIRGLGYTSPIELGTTGYGQTWSTIQTYGKEVADSDPQKNTLFLLQLYSELANAIPATLNSIAAFGSPVNVDSCLFPSTYGNTADTYKQVWDQSYAKGFGSFYWDWWGDGDGNSMTSGGTLASLNAIGQYIANDSPAALKNTVKTTFLQNAAVP